MRVSIVPDDNMVTVDGVSRDVDLSGIDTDIHAVQISDGVAEIEYRDRRAPLVTTDVARFQQTIDHWAAADPGPPPPATPRDHAIAAIGSGTPLGELIEVLGGMGLGRDADEIRNAITEAFPDA